MCVYCGDNAEVQGFGSFLQYLYIRSCLLERVRKGELAVVRETPSEIVYECMRCHDRWTLSVMGTLHDRYLRLDK